MTRRQIRFYRIASGCLGAFIVLIALIVFLGQGSRFIDLRHDSGNPAQPYKQSNYKRFR